MAFNHDSGDGMMSEINVTPLVDVMLVLLVVFIITAPLLAPQSLQIDLPKTGAVPHAETLQTASLVVDAHGGLVLDNRHIGDEDLKDWLRARAGEPQFQLRIEADSAVPYGRVAELMALAQQAGVSRLAFVTLARQAGAARR